MQNEEITNELNRLKSDIAGLREDMASLLGAMKDAGVEQGRTTYNRASERAQRVREQVREQAGEVYGTLGREVEEHPFTSVLTAFGTGFVIGMLLDRRR
jgi:ElaB/YqjD/DUF883 family membrane-anchored ribosome-binding protein